MRRSPFCIFNWLLKLCRFSRVFSFSLCNVNGNQQPLYTLKTKWLKASWRFTVSKCLGWCYKGIRVFALKSKKEYRKTTTKTPPHIFTCTQQTTSAILMIALSFSPFAVLVGRSIRLSGRAVSTFHLRGNVMILLGRYWVAVGVAAATAAFRAASSSPLPPPSRKCQAAFPHWETHSNSQRVWMSFESTVVVGGLWGRWVEFSWSHL